MGVEITPVIRSAPGTSRSMNEPATNLKPGNVVPPFTVETLSHGPRAVPGQGLTHLQFRRFAGCPVCNLHLRQFAQSVDRLEAAGVRTVAFVHSSAEAMQPYQGDLPFHVVPDPEKQWYRRFGVEASLGAMLHPKAMWAAMRGMVQAKMNPLAGEGGMSGLPADVLLDAAGRVLAVKYGAHADDSWSVDEVLALASATPHA